MKGKTIQVGVIFLCVFTIFVTAFFSKQSVYRVLHTENAQSSDEIIKIRFISSWGALDVRADSLQHLFKNFTEQYPGTRIINESLSDEDFLLKLKTDFSSGNAPDVFCIWPGADVFTLIKNKQVEDLTEILEQDLEWKNSFDRSTWRYVTVDNHIYGLPMEIDSQGLFVNKDLFSLHHIKIPEKYEELETAVKAFREKGIIPIAANYTKEGSMLYQSIAAMLGGVDDIDALYRANEVRPCFLTAMDYLKKLHQMGAFPDNAISLDDKSRNDLFLGKRAAMMVQKASFIGAVNKQPNLLEPNIGSESAFQYKSRQMTVDFKFFPTIEGGKADRTAIIYGLGAGTFFMSSQAAQSPIKREAVVNLLKFMTSKESATMFAEQACMLSAIKIPTPNVYYSSLMVSERNMILSTKEMIAFPDSMINQLVWNEELVKQFPYVFEGKKDVATVWKTVMKHRK